MAKINLKIRKSNWETVVFLLIYDYLETTGKHFIRSELMRTENIDKAVKWLQHLNHKKFPTHPGETFQKNIQNLRDKGYIIFHGQGEYELTNSGIEECRRVAKELNVQTSNIEESIKIIKKEYDVKTLEEARKILKGLPPDKVGEILKRLATMD